MGLVDRNRNIIAIKGAGEMATGVAVRLKRAGFSKIFIMCSTTIIIPGREL